MTVWISAEILSVSDGISSLVIFILFYINIYMFWIKIDFYRLIWLTKNIKKIVIFHTRQTPKNVFDEKYFKKKWLS